ncbi:hypothetical protein ACFQBQ_12605 [Granulicella cerasi]|uniref:Glycine zipper domain-containing protein n=1 Tax=Granulicella cerasi TaxID=741063 RepID=A0ABW1ZBW1_9BACT|nr:hypothetical protein [Granulicella cerasi]
MNMMKIAAKVALISVVSLPLAAGAQTYREHEEAKHAQERSDARHHTKAKVVGGSAAGGAVIGAVAGGPKGALIGAGVGAGGGLLANKARKDHDVKKRERSGRY